MANYHLPVFHFQATWGNATLGFSEITGLNIEHQVIEYRDGMMSEYSPLKQPGIPKYSNITFKRGIVKGANDFFEWLNKTKMNVADRKDIIISLLDETGTAVVTWTAKNAFPVKIEGPGLKATGNEVAIESIEVAHEGLTISHG